MKIAIGCDPNAQQAKEELIKFMEDKGYGEIKDFGSEDPIYANTAVAVAEAVASGEYDRGILICGTGLGVSIAANKVKVLMQHYFLMYTQPREPVSATMPTSHVWELSQSVTN